VRSRFDALNVTDTQPLDFRATPGGREMGFIDTLRHRLRRTSHTTTQPCPPESDILKYQEGTLSASARARLEPHFAACHDCRELLLLLTRFPEKEAAAQPPLSAAEIQQQTAHIFQYVEADDRRKADERAAGNQPLPAPRRGWVYRHRAQLATATVVICALVVGGLYLLTPRATESARQSLALAMKDERRSAARLSGGFDYSRYEGTRGADESPDFHLRRAVSELKAAESDTASTEMRQMLARAYLAFNYPDRARQAQAILESLLQSRHVETAELFNDLGVAQFQLRDYGAAVTSFDRALTINSAYTEALFNRALAKESAGRYADARSDWEALINSKADAQWKPEAKQHLDSLSSPSL